MVGWEQIKAMLTPTSNMTTRDIAKAINLSAGHTRRVLVHMRDVEGWAVGSGSPARWSKKK